MLFKRSNNTVTKTSLMVIAYLTEGYKIRFQTNDFIHNSFISPGTTVPSCQMFHCNTVKRSYDRACTKANAIVTNRLNKNLFIVDSFKILIPAKIKTFCQIFTYDIQNIIVSLFLSNQILSKQISREKLRTAFTGYLLCWFSYRIKESPSNHLSVQQLFYSSSPLVF